MLIQYLLNRCWRHMQFRKTTLLHMKRLNKIKFSIYSFVFFVSKGNIFEFCLNSVRSIEARQTRRAFVFFFLAIPTRPNPHIQYGGQI